MEPKAVSDEAPAHLMTGERPAGPRREGGDLDETAAELREVLRVARALGGISDEAELLDLINTTAREKLGYSVCVIAIRGDDGAFRYAATSGASVEEERALRNCVLSASAFEALRDAAVTIGAVCWVAPGHPVRERPDVRAGTLATGVSVAPRSWQPGSLLFAPLIGADGEAVGLLNPDDPLSGELPTPRQALLLETLAELTVVGLEIVRARAVERAAAAVGEAQRRQLEGLLVASAQVRGQFSLDEVLSEIARAMTTAGGFGRAAIYLRMPDDVLAVGATVGLTDAESEQLRASTVTLKEFAPAMQPEMLLSRSFLFDHRRFEIPPELNEKLNTPIVDREWTDGQWHPEDMLTVPISDLDGELLGVISVDEPVDGLLPDRAHVQAIEFFADQCAVAVVQARRYEEVRAEARTDALTGLANRRALDAAVVRAISRGRREAALCAVLFIDIDHFKDINDTLGHAVGDAVLQRVGRGLRDRLRRGDLLARYGGEEFVALLSDTDLQAAMRVAETLRRRIATLEFDSLTGGLPVRVSIGVAQLSEDRMSAGSLVSAADAAMYEAKRQGRNRVCVAP
ncbi:MAG TPA: sensor domain-containing diguanylate cyclase [Acidimicrobiales bacterium]|nr:sensor domain-containing diguanylate cyclase [Acidimicrobiales bacterium]